MSMSRVFHALSDPTRRQILKLLRQRDHSAGELAEHFPFAKSTMSGHFNVLRHAGLILSEKHGTFIRYRLNTSAMQEALGWAMDLMDIGQGEDASRESQP